MELFCIDVCYGAQLPFPAAVIPRKMGLEVYPRRVLLYILLLPIKIGFGSPQNSLYSTLDHGG